MSARGGVVAWLAVSAVAMSVTVAGAVTLGGVGSDQSALASDEAACAVEAADEAAAERLAIGCGHDVEVVSARTEWNSLYAQPDGAMRFEVSAAAVRTKVTGQWGPVDNALVEVDGGYEVVAAVTPMRFGGAGDGAPLVRMWRDGHELTMDLPFDLPEPTLTQDDQLTYAQVLPGVDLIVTVNPDATGFSEVLRVQSPQAAADPRLRELVLPMETSSGLTLEAH